MLDSPIGDTGATTSFRMGACCRLDDFMTAAVFVGDFDAHNDD